MIGLLLFCAGVYAIGWAVWDLVGLVVGGLVLLVARQWRSR